MSKKLRWNKYVLEQFIELALLTEEEQNILKTRIAGWTITKQALEFGMSTSKVNRIVAEIKAKYDNIVEYYPDIFPKRYVSEKEKYMDEN